MNISMKKVIVNNSKSEECGPRVRVYLSALCSNEADMETVELLISLFKVEPQEVTINASHELEFKGIFYLGDKV